MRKTASYTQWLLLQFWQNLCNRHAVEFIFQFSLNMISKLTITHEACPGALMIDFKSWVFEKLWVIWYHLYNLKNVKNTHGKVIILVKLQAEI